MKLHIKPDLMLTLNSQQTTHPILHKQFICPHTHTTNTHTHSIHYIYTYVHTAYHYLWQHAASPTHAKTYPMHQPHVQWDLRPFQHFVASVTSLLVSAETHPLTKLIYPIVENIIPTTRQFQFCGTVQWYFSPFRVLVQGLCIEHCNHSRDTTVTCKRL